MDARVHREAGCINREENNVFQSICEENAIIRKRANFVVQTHEKDAEVSDNNAEQNVAAFKLPS